MKITYGEIVDSGEMLRILSGMRLPVMVSLQIAQLSSKLGEISRVVVEVWNGLVNTYGQQQESGEILVVSPDDPLRRPVSPEWDKFEAEITKLRNQEVELDIEKIKLPRRVDGKSLVIEPSILIALEKFIEVG